MSATKPFKTTRAVLADGRPLFNLQETYVVQGSQIMPGHVVHIDISGKEAGDFPTIRATVHDALTHTLDVGIAIVPTKKQVGPGLRHISDPNPRGIRFCRMYQYDDNGNRTIAQEEIDFLFAWHAQHGATGGTGDPSQHPDPASIPWTPWQPGAGKPGGTGQPGGGEPVVTENPGKGSGGDISIHPADTNADHRISGEEKRAFKDKTGQDVKKGEY